MAIFFYKIEFLKSTVKNYFQVKTNFYQWLEQSTHFEPKATVLNKMASLLYVDNF